MNETVKVGWYCSFYVGPPKWSHGTDWVYEPDECGTEFETAVPYEEWELGECGAVCPECGAQLYQYEAEPWLVGNEQG